MSSEKSQKKFFRKGKFVETLQLIASILEPGNLCCS